MGVQDPNETLVPPGHAVTVTPYSPIPGLVRTRGGALLVDLGIRGSAQRAEVEQLFCDVWDALHAPGPRVHIALSTGQLSGLFAPHDVPIATRDALVIWTVHQGAFHGFMETLEGVQTLLRLFYRIAQLPGERAFVLYLVDPKYAATGLIPLLRGLGIEVQTPDPSGGVLLEVVRPEGIVLSALMGGALADGSPTSDAALHFNRRKDAAQQQQNASALAQIEAEERAFLQRAWRLLPAEPAWPPRTAALRESRLRQLMLHHQQAPQDHSRRVLLLQALLAHDRPLLLMGDGQGQASRMQWGQQVATLVFCDVVSLRQCQIETGRVDPRFAPVELPFAEIIRLLLQSNEAAALNTFARAHQPLYTLLRLPTLRALALARPPTQAEWDAAF